MKRVLKLSCLILYTIALSACASGAPVMSTGVSTDGRYVITAHSGGGLYLWDIQKKEKKHLAKNAYSYSAYFIPDSHEFMWQDDNDIVHIQDINGKEIKSFKHFKTEGQIMTADKSFYLSADTWGKLYKGYGDNLVPIYTDEPVGPSQPYTLSIHGNYILSTYDTITGRNDPPAETNLTANPVNPDIHKKSSYDGVTLWDKTTLKPIARLWGNSGRTTGRISPDGKWVVTGSDNRGNFMWSVQTPDNKIKGYDKSKLLPVPEKFNDMQKAGLFSVLAVAFLSDKDFILFDRNAKDRIHPIYTTGDVWIQGYVDLGERKSISHSNLSIGSSPKAHILAISQGSGIAVYRYHPETKELEKIWVAD